jgi:D-amino-acid oxidase
LKDEKSDPSLPRSGLKIYDAYKYWDFPVTENIWWAPYVKDFRTLAVEQNPVCSINQRTRSGDPNIVEALAFKEIAIDVSQYLLYLQQRARKAGATVLKKRLSVNAGLENALAEAEREATGRGGAQATCFVNATGLGAAKLCGDEAMYPIRGQTVLVKGEPETLYTRSGKDYGSYCIARPGSGSTILGGTKEVGNWSETPDPRVTEQILKHAALNIPELMTGSDGGFEVISVQCGLRPGRKGGPRLEKEIVGGRKVVHAYGHAGGGYQNSIGSARLAMKLVEESIGTAPPESKL